MAAVTRVDRTSKTRRFVGSGRLALSLAGMVLRPPFVSFALVVAYWWWFSAGQPTYILPSPLEVTARLVQLTVGTRELLGALSLSLSALLIGGALAFVVSVPLGLVMGANPNVENIFEPYVSALYVAPVSALTPVFVWFLGTGLAPRVATVFVFCAPIIVLICFRGARETPSAVVDVARVFGAQELQVFKKAIVPHSVPYIATAARLGLGRAIKGTVLAELVISITGLGELLSGYAHRFDTTSVIATLLFLLFIGVIMTGLIARFEAAIAPWKQTS